MQGCGFPQTVWRQLAREVGSRAPNQATARVEAQGPTRRLIIHRPNVFQQRAVPQISGGTQASWSQSRGLRGTDDTNPRLRRN